MAIAAIVQSRFMIVSSPFGFRIDTPEGLRPSAKKCSGTARAVR